RAGQHPGAGPERAAGRVVPRARSDARRNGVRMAWGRKDQERAPAEVLDAGVPPGDKLLAAARDELGDQWVLATTTRIAVVGPDGGVRVSRPWLDVDRGAWDPDSDLLRVTWVIGG